MELREQLRSPHRLHNDTEPGDDHTSLGSPLMAKLNLKFNYHVSHKFYDAINAYNEVIVKYPNLAKQSLSDMPSMQDMYETSFSNDQFMVINPS